jgi:hypothetical protein
MKTPVTFSVSYFIKAQKVKGNHVPIYALVSLNGQKITISAKQSIEVEQWSKNGGRAKRGNQNKRKNQPLPRQM